MEERSQQVSMMPEIYTKASIIIAWFGEEDEYTVPEIRLLYGLFNLRDWPPLLYTAMVGANVGRTRDRPGEERSSCLWPLHGVWSQSEWDPLTRGVPFVYPFVHREKVWGHQPTLDKVYGILGLHRGFGITPQLEVRYRGMTVCDLYMLATELIYKKRRNLEFLGSVEANQSIDRIRRFNLPSWAPEFTLPVNYLPIFGDGRYAPRRTDKVDVSRERSETFAFTGGSQSCCEFDFKTKTITVLGFRVDTIRRIESSFMDLKNSKADHAVRMAHTVTYGKPICQLPPAGVEESKLEKIWDYFLGHECSQARTWINAKRIGVESNFPPPLVNLQAFQTTEMGLCGATDAAIRPKDRIRGLLGLGVPCILRQHNDSWRFVGLSGIVDLEVMRGSLMEGLKTGAFTLEKFTIG
ncbi:hypothetical protein O1611_g1323 [Lasiodiplodia mahajangana]|uniref:Uncharacterized protein n=1 Tax=Lasiodiplodia mahajangana TaxID=1108764 RepID=A0ACC2JXZ3_9PEZI|nr:hypothetical protein O1611_g1323 [Lasiodiplodia mahajangana]